MSTGLRVVFSPRKLTAQLSPRGLALTLAQTRGPRGPTGPAGIATNLAAIKFTGHGVPPDLIVGASPGDLYLDVDTFDVYQLT